MQVSREVEGHRQVMHKQRHTRMQPHQVQGRVCGGILLPEAEWLLSSGCSVRLSGHSTAVVRARHAGAGEGRVRGREEEASGQARRTEMGATRGGDVSLRTGRSGEGWGGRGGEAEATSEYGDRKSATKRRRRGQRHGTDAREAHT